MSFPLLSSYKRLEENKSKIGPERSSMQQAEYQKSNNLNRKRNWDVKFLLSGVNKENRTLKNRDTFDFHIKIQFNMFGT